MMLTMSKRKRQDGWWYPWLFVGGFAIVIAVNGTMAFLAVDTWTGLETEQPFQRGQAYNQELAQKAAQDKLGWTVTLDAGSLSRGEGGELRLSFQDAQNQGVGNLTIEAQAFRPTQDGFDQPLTFIEQGGGVYAAPARLPLPGQWELRITASRADEVFKMRQRIQVP